MIKMRETASPRHIHRSSGFWDPKNARYFSGNGEVSKEAVS